MTPSTHDSSIVNSPWQPYYGYPTCVPCSRRRRAGLPLCAASISMSKPARPWPIVGESGCGKSVTALSIMRLLPEQTSEIAAGQVLFQGRDLLQLSEDEMRAVRGNEISMIFQEPMTSLNPVMSIGNQIIETLRAHRNISWAEARAQAITLLERVRIADAETQMNEYSAPAVRRHAPTRNDRHGTGVRSQNTDRG